MSAPTRREAAKEKNRALILSAARGVFDDLGYAQATVRDIVRATPLASGTFYNYFKSKEAIYQALRDDEALALRPLLAASRAAAATAQDFIAGGFRLFFNAALSARVDVPPGGLKVRMDTPEILAGQSELEADIAAASEKGLLPKVDARLLAAALAGMAFELSGTLAGLAGSMKMFVTQNASLTDVHWTMSGEVVLMTLVGGLGTSFGPIVGAFIIVAMQQYLASFGQWVMVMQGAVFIICVLTFRRGIVGEIAHYFKRSL